MENRKVGFIVIAIAIVIGFIVYSFNMALADIVSTACSHGPDCPMWGTLEFQTNVGLGLTFFIIAIGIFLVLFGKETLPAATSHPRVKVSEVKRENYQEVLDSLHKDEADILGAVIDEKGSIFQSALVEQSGISKVKVTRILDRLEGKGLVERKRRGMTNVVVLKS